MALAVKMRAHLLNLKIGHIAKAPAKTAFVRTPALKCESFNQTLLRQRLLRRSYKLRNSQPFFAENADNMRTAGDPDKGLILLRLQMSSGEDIEEFRMQRPLI